MRFATCSPCCVSKSAIIRESPAAARRVPAGEKETVRTGFVKPEVVSSVRVYRDGEAYLAKNVSSSPNHC